MAHASTRLLLLLALLALIFTPSHPSSLGGVEGLEDPQGEVNLDKNTAYNNVLKCLQNQSADCPLGTALNESGILMVNSTTQQQYCGGNCANQTLVELSCMSNVISGFRFNNDATISDVKKAIQIGCLTGNFSVHASSNGATSVMKVLHGSSWILFITIATFLPFV